MEFILQFIKGGHITHGLVLIKKKSGLETDHTIFTNEKCESLNSV